MGMCVCVFAAVLINVKEYKQIILKIGNYVIEFQD